MVTNKSLPRSLSGLRSVCTRVRMCVCVCRKWEKQGKGEQRAFTFFSSQLSVTHFCSVLSLNLKLLKKKEYLLQEASVEYCCMLTMALWPLVFSITAGLIVKYQKKSVKSKLNSGYITGLMWLWQFGRYLFWNETQKGVEKCTLAPAASSVFSPWRQSLALTLDHHYSPSNCLRCHWCLAHRASVFIAHSNATLTQYSGAD